MDSLPLSRADSLPLAALLGAVDVVSPRRAAQAAALASPPSPSAAHAAAAVPPPSPSEHYRLVAAQRASDARSFIALVAGRFPIFKGFHPSELGRASIRFPPMRRRCSDVVGSRRRVRWRDGDGLE